MRTAAAGFLLAMAQLIQGMMDKPIPLPSSIDYLVGVALGLCFMQDVSEIAYYFRSK